MVGNYVLWRRLKWNFRPYNWRISPQMNILNTIIPQLTDVNCIQVGDILQSFRCDCIFCNFLQGKPHETCPSKHILEKDLDKYIKAIWFVQCKIKFYFTEWTAKAVFSQVVVAFYALATSENTSFGVHEWNKIQSYTDKIKLCTSFMLFFLQQLSFYLLFDSHARKQTFFSSHFASILSSSECLGGIKLGENAVLHLENEPK